MDTASGGSRYDQDLVWLDDDDVSLGLKVSRMTGNYRELVTSNEDISAMRTMRRTVRWAHSPSRNKFSMHRLQLHLIVFLYDDYDFTA